MSSYQWDAFSVLDVYPAKERHCIGYAPSQRRRCHNPIAFSNSGLANCYLTKLGTLDPKSGEAKALLKSIATACLCVRNHQSQAASFLDDWGRLLNSVDGRNPAAVPRYLAPSSTTARDVPVRTSHPISTGRPRVQEGDLPPGDTPILRTPSLNTTVRTSRRLVRGERRAQQEEVRTILGSIQVPQTADRASSAVSNATTVATSTQTLHDRHSPQARVSSNARAPSDRLPPPQTLQPQPPSEPQPPRLPVQIVPVQIVPEVEAPRTTDVSVDATAHIESDTNTTSTSPCSQTHVERRPLADTCEICYESMLPSEELLWCKSTCGNSCHAECVRCWHSQQIAEHRPATCTHCRGLWADLCEHDSILPPTPAPSSSSSSSSTTAAEDSLLERTIRDARQVAMSVLESDDSNAEVEIGSERYRAALRSKILLTALQLCEAV